MQKDLTAPRNNPLRLIQITDTHLYRDPHAELLGLNTQKSFDQILDLIASNRAAADVIIGTGDIAQDASVQSYHRFAAGMAKLNAPFYWIPGNHDSRKTMFSLPEYQAANNNHIVQGNWQILMLDTSVENNVHGFLAEAELNRLRRQLSQLSDGVQHSLICFHHNPVPGLADWMSDIGLTNADELLAVLKEYPLSVRAVVYGHIHQSLDFMHEGFRFLCTPSTCIQFKAHAEDFTLDMEAPAYRWLDLHADGELETGVERLRNYTVNVDINAGGY